LDWFLTSLCLAALPARVLAFPPRAQTEQPQEADLVHAARAGQRRAQHLLYQRHVATVYASVGRLLGNSADADDVVQDAFVAAFQDLDQLDTPERFGPWLKAIAVHQVHRRLRRRDLLRRLGFSHPDNDLGLSQAVNPAASPEVKTMLRQLDQGLAQLKPVLRIAWLLRHVDGCTLADVAGQCGVSAATAKRHLKRAEQELRRYVEFEQPPRSHPEDEERIES